MATEKTARRWRKGAIALAVFVLISLGIGPRLVDRYFDKAIDSVADQLGSVEVRAVPMSEDPDPLFVQTWAFGEDSALGAAPVPKAQAQAAARDRGVPVGGMTTRFIVESNRAEDLVITGMRARVLESGAPLTGTLLLPNVGGGPEPVPIVMARFKVGGADPRAYDGREPDRLLFGDKTLVLSRGESMILQVTGVAVDCYCEWVVDVEFAIGTEIRTITVPDTDHPLRITAPVPRYQSAYQAAPDDPDNVVTAIDPAQACAGDCVVNQPPWREP